MKSKLRVLNLISNLLAIFTLIYMIFTSSYYEEGVYTFSEALIRISISLVIMVVCAIMSIVTSEDEMI